MSVTDVGRSHPGGHVPVDPANVISGPILLMLVEIEARPAQRTLVRANPLIADLLPRIELDVAKLAPDVLRHHGMGTALSNSPRISSAWTFSACARTVRAMR